MMREECFNNNAVKTISNDSRMKKDMHKNNSKDKIKKMKKDGVAKKRSAESLTKKDVG